MRGVSIHQLVSGFAQGDAISHEAMALRRVCRELKFPSEIYAPADRIAPDSIGECRSLDDFHQRASDVVICHYSISSPATESFLSSPARKVLIYHNITPAEFYAPFDSGITQQLTEARNSLHETARRADVVWADSAFNASELAAAGIEGVKVFPIIFTPANLDLPPDPRILEQFRTPMRNILFVGRVAPNKCVEELITAFAWYHRRIEPMSRLIVVGSDHSTPAYFAMLRMYAGELELPTVCFQRFASPAGLCAYYQMADLFVTASRHEGYCLPLVEAMYKGVPVIARNTGGMPEAMGGAGILYEDLSPQELAVLFQRVLTDAPLRQEITNSQRHRVETILARRIPEEFLSLLSELIPNA